MTNTIPDFETLAGSARVEQNGPENPEATATGSLTFIADMDIEGEGPCRALWLKTQDESVVAVAISPSGRAFICPGGPENCQGKPLTAAAIEGNIIQRPSDISDNRYRIEFLDNLVIYRIQEKECLVPYPHGCLIHGKGWDDKHVYKFYTD